MSGTVTLTDGEVLEDVDLTGWVDIQGDNITVRSVRIPSGGARYGIDANTDFTGNLFEDLELDGQLTNDSIGVYGRGFTLRRAHIHGHRTGVMVNGAVVVQGNYVHDSWHEKIRTGLRCRCTPAAT